MDAPGIFSLPFEILDNIVKLVYGLGIPDPRAWADMSYRSHFDPMGKVWLEKMKDCAEAPVDMQSLRLVCRAFQDLATPYLFPYITVDLSILSLDRLEALCSSAVVAPGIRGVQLDLRYHPPEIAADLDLFAHLCRFDAYRMAEELDWYREGVVEMDHPEDYFWDDLIGDPEIWPRPRLQGCEHTKNCLGGPEDKRCNPSRRRVMRALDKADIFLDIMSRSFWSDIMECHRRGVPPEAHQRVRDVFLGSHGGFAQKAEAEISILQDGSFTRRLTTALSRLPNCVAIRFNDGGPDKRDLGDVDAYEILAWEADDELLSAALQRPLAWADLKGRRKKTGAPELGLSDFKIEPARLIEDVPSALLADGVSLKYVRSSATMYSELQRDS